jgi:hypothetical protein
MATLAPPAAAVKPARPAATSRRAAIDQPASPEGGGFTWELGPDPADARWNAEQDTDYHFDGPTPAEVLDGPEPDWDGMADEAAALDRLCAGCLL